MFYKMPSLLKRTLFLFLSLLLLVQATHVQAQSTSDTIESLVVDIWPDYDRPSVLVLLTGILPASAFLPATITLPIPEDADVTAVARIASDDNLFSDITFDESVPGQVTLTTPDPRFRVEYYMPYELDGAERTFTFEWQAQVSVTQMAISVQQPVGTTSMATDPAVFSVTPRQDGFQYHNLPPREVPAGQAVSLQVTYARAASQLSSELLQPETINELTTTDGQTQTTTSQPAPETNLNITTILLASLGVAVLAVGTWMLFGERLVVGRRETVRTRSRETPARPSRQRAQDPVYEDETATAKATPPPSFAKFCHQCGQKAESDDRFCRSCGTRLKN